MTEEIIPLPQTVLFSPLVMYPETLAYPTKMARPLVIWPDLQPKTESGSGLELRKTQSPYSYS